MLELGNRSIEYVVTSYQLLHIGIAAIPARKGSLSYNFASYYYRLCLQMHQIILWNRIGIHCSSRHLLFSLTESPPIATLGIIDGQTSADPATQLSPPAPAARCTGAINHDHGIAARRRTAISALRIREDI